MPIQCFAIMIDDTINILEHFYFTLVQEFLSVHTSTLLDNAKLSKVTVPVIYAHWQYTSSCAYNLINTYWLIFNFLSM